MFNRKSSLLVVALAVMASMFSLNAAAGTTGAEFLGMYTTVLGWAQGYLGKSIAIGAFLIGAFVGFAKSTVMPALIGIAFGLLFSVGPGIIDAMITGVI